LLDLQAGEKKLGTDESRFNVVLASRNFAQLRATFDEYVKVHIHTVQFINCIQAVQPLDDNNHLGLNLTGRCVEAVTRNVSVRMKVSCMVATTIPSRLVEVSVRDSWPCVARDSSALIAFVELSGTLTLNWPVRYQKEEHLTYINLGPIFKIGIFFFLLSLALLRSGRRLYRERRVKWKFL